MLTQLLLWSVFPDDTFVCLNMHYNQTSYMFGNPLVSVLFILLKWFALFNMLVKQLISICFQTDMYENLSLKIVLCLFKCIGSNLRVLKMLCVTFRVIAGTVNELHICYPYFTQNQTCSISQVVLKAHSCVAPQMNTPCLVLSTFCCMFMLLNLKNATYYI